MTYIETVARWLIERFAEAKAATAEDLTLALRVLAIWRASTLVDEFVARHGLKILQGPFAGMDYVRTATEGAILPRLLGSYESELHPAIAAFAADAPEVVIDVGCAEGYYAVGLARLMPGAVVRAHDTDPKAQAACRALADLNGVGARVVTGGAFAPEGFEAFAGRRCLVIVDIEGGELDLLRPDLSPALAGMSLIVETHDVYRPGALAEITARFAATHEIRRLDLGPKTLPLPDWLAARSHMDQLLAVWEWRLRPTPWLVMTPK